MTPLRLSEIGCPRCHETHWIIDSDYRGIGRPDVPYRERDYACPICGQAGSGWTVLVQSPPEFFLQPHDMYPMTKDEFDRWATILRAHFPDSPFVSRLDLPRSDDDDDLFVSHFGRFFPRTPEEAAARDVLREEIHLRLRGHILEMRGSRRRKERPSEWDLMDGFSLVKPGNPLSLAHEDGSRIEIAAVPDGRFSLICLGSDAQALAEAPALDRDAVRKVMLAYLDGDSHDVMKIVRRPSVRRILRKLAGYLRR